ncbi:IS5-like element ISAva8 family transposase (plasmid) [Trichormus variabilis ARAD]|uniref:IS5-like element ISAva8 family transposase n=1 Tax=Trichormus variabilis N2B TaxID=2681315 RepID=A0ABR6SHB3_ANAVA|nr:IS5-like element ISAva8 family transposase [Trichormus variabilis]MBC1259383.1 IS5-like element ISAva8 family transposase [Trichormus variabilis V5]MBC1270880.1 IS5-like element ISAva8 family transposase [Trichormus variabilis FSR]MBC1305792.1 IS5-like element ISAva8 family transposase [Trichormus variabilis N2B]MBC1314837.1 IS5-like element ISAva8 family transposase [Trichormus variabilis PNB]MBC1329621.1 IS5-like element ISAva8 family transposase [Trichormus variabilis 9RC]QFZ15700.1 IS5
MARKSYPTDLTDIEWEILSELIPPAKTGGHPRTTDMREICNAIYYHLKTGCQWNMLPGDFPPSSTVYSYYRKWQRKGVWEKLNHTLRGQVRSKLGKSTQPTAIAADSQSVKTDQKKGNVYGFDGCKKVKGRKRQTLVDSLGLLLKVVVSEANAPERVLAAYALMELLEERPELLEKVKVMWVDSGYDGDKFALCVWLMIQAHVEVIRRTEQEFQVLPKRWVVERTFGWFNQYHRLSKDYERLTEMSEAAIYAVMTRIMLRRLVS